MWIDSKQWRSKHLETPKEGQLEMKGIFMTNKKNSATQVMLQETKGSKFEQCDGISHICKPFFEVYVSLKKVFYVSSWNEFEL